VGHGRSNSFDRMIALEPFRRSASGRNKLPTYLGTTFYGPIHITKDLQSQGPLIANTRPYGWSTVSAAPSVSKWFYVQHDKQCDIMRQSSLQAISSIVCLGHNDHDCIYESYLCDPIYAT